jgi:hypothetical protein
MLSTLTVQRGGLLKRGGNLEGGCGLGEFSFIVGIPFGSCCCTHVLLLSPVMDTIVGRQTYILLAGMHAIAIQIGIKGYLPCALHFCVSIIHPSFCLAIM